MARIETRDGRYEDYPESSQTSDNIVNTVNDLIENRGYSASEVREYSKNILKNQPELLNQVLNMVGEEQQGTTQQPQINPLIAGEPEQPQQREIPALIASNPQELPPTTRIANKVEEALTKKTPVQIGNGTSVPEVALMTKSERIAHKSAEMAAKFKGAPTTLEELRAVNPRVSPQEEAAFLQAQREREFLSNPDNLGTLPNSDPYTLGEVAGDATNAVTQGVVEGVGAAYGLANFASENNLYKTTKKAIDAVSGTEQEAARESSSLDSYTGFSAKLKRASDFWERLLQSDNAKATDEQIKASMDKYGSKVDEQIKERVEEGYPEWVAEAEGLGKKAYNSAKEYAKNPSAIVFEVIQEIPSIVTGGAIGKGATELLVQGVDPKVAKRFFNTKRGKELQEKVATRAGVASAAVSEASSNALETKAEILTKSEKELTATSPIYNDYRAAGLDHEQARMKVSDDGFNVVFGLTLPVGAATSKLTGAGKLEGNLFIPNSNLASAVQKNASAFFKEGVEEAIQGGAGQTIQNLGKRETADETQELTEGVGEAIGQGAVVGAGAGLTITGIATAPQLAAGTLETTAKGGTAFAEVAKEVTKQVKETVNNKVNEATATNETINKAVKTGNLDEITNTESENYSGVDALGALVNPKFIPAQDVDNDESDEEYEGRLNEYLEKITTHDANAMRELSEMRDASPEERKAAVNRYKKYQSQAVGLIKAIKSGTVAEAIDNLKNEQSSEEDVDTVLGSMADGIFSTVTEEQAEALATNTNLTDEQKTQVEAFIALKKAQGVLSRGGTTKKVQQEILHGSDGALGLNDYTNLLTKAVRAKDRDSARVALTNLSEFAKTQRTKANAIREAYKTAVATNTTVPVKVGDTTYNIHKGSNNSGFIDAVQEDTQAVISTFTSLKKFAIAGLSGEQQQEQQVAPEQATSAVEPTTTTQPTANKTSQVDLAKKIKRVNASTVSDPEEFYDFITTTDLETVPTDVLNAFLDDKTGINYETLTDEQFDTLDPIIEKAVKVLEERGVVESKEKTSNEKLKEIQAAFKSLSLWADKIDNLALNDEGSLSDEDQAVYDKEIAYYEELRRAYPEEAKKFSEYLAKRRESGLANQVRGSNSESQAKQINKDVLASIEKSTTEELEKSLYRKEAIVDRNINSDSEDRSVSDNALALINNEILAIREELAKRQSGNNTETTSTQVDADNSFDSLDLALDSDASREDVEVLLDGVTEDAFKLRKELVGSLDDDSKDSLDKSIKALRRKPKKAETIKKHLDNIRTITGQQTTDAETNTTNTTEPQTEESTPEEEVTKYTNRTTSPNNEWSGIGAQFNVVNDDTDTDVENTEVTAEAVAQGEFVADQWGYKNTADEGFLTRVWNQVSNSDAVFAIATGFQQTTSGALRVKGSEGYPVQMAINAGKPAYVFNQETGDWLEYSQEDGFFKVIDEAPTLTPNFAGVAGKNISEGARQAINDVYSKTFPDVDESSRLRNIDPNAFIADTSETVALDETTLEGSSTLTDSLEDKEKPEPKVDFMQDTVVDNLASKVFTATAEDNVYAETDDILDELEPYSEDINIPQTTIKFLKNTKDMLFNSVDKIFGLNPENFINNNYLEAFRKEGSNGFKDGLAENIKNAITVATAEWLLDREDSLRELTIADIASLTGLTQDSVQNNNALLSYYKDKGVPLQVVSQEIGRKVIRSLKIKARPSAEHNADDKLARAIGNMVTLSLADLGVLTLGEVKGIYRDGAINPDEVYKYVRLNKNNTKFIKNLQGKQDSIETLSKFLDIKEDTTTFPQFTAPTVKDTVNKAGTKISKRLKAALKKYTARAFRIEPTNFSAFKVLGTDTIADIMGYERYPDRVHTSRLDGVEMRNRQIMDSIKYLEEFADHLETNGSGLNQQFYYSSEVDVNGRARIIQKRVNPQTDKLARAMTTMEGWEYTVDNQGARNLFKVALAQAFDIKVDKLTLHTSLKQIDAIMRGEGEKGQAYVNGVAALKRLMNNESSSIEDDRRIVAESVAVMGEKAHSLQGLIAATNYSDTQPFKSTLTMEIDGITNGTALGLLQFAPLGKQIRSWLAKVGIFLDHRISFGFARESGDIPHDNYETLAIAMQEEMLKLERVGRAGRDYKINQYMSIANSELRKIRMIGNLLSKSYAHISGRHRSQKAQDKLDLFGVVRDIAKNPVMIGNYGAGNNKIIAEFVNELINNIYVSLEDASNNKSADEVALIKQDLEAVLGHDINLSLENALTWELKGRDLAAFTESVEDTFGYAMKQALKKEFGLIQEKRTKFNQMLSAINTVYTTVWNERYKEILDEKGIFTKADAKALRKELADLMPLVSTANSNGAEEELNLLKNQAQGSQNFKDLIQLVYKNKPAGQHTMKFHKTLKAFADTINYQDVGSRPTVFGIQSTDSAIMAENLLADYDSLNIYDAVIVKPTDAILAAETLNEATYRLNREHSMYADGARRLQQVLAKYPKKYEERVSEELEITFANEMMYQELTPNEVIDGALAEANVIFNDRKKLFSSIKYITQYNMEAGGHYANRTDSESIAKRIEYLVDQIKTTLGSDANAFISPASMQEFDLTNSTVLGLMNNLRASATVGSSLEHANRLDTLMGTTFNTLINPLKLYVGTSAAENQGIFDYTNQEIKVNLKTGARTSGLELGADEVLAHEVVHSIVKEALESNSGYARAIREMWYQARKVITPDDLRSAGDSADVAQKRWDYIFNNPNKIGKYSVGLHEFVAFGLTNEKMINALNNKVSPNTEENNPNNTLWDKLRNLYTKMLRMFSERLKGINAANSSDRLVKLTKHLVEAERKAQQVAYKNTFVNKIEDSIQAGLVEYIQQPLLKLLVNQRDKGITSTSKVRNIVGGFAAAGEIAITGRFKEFKNIIDDVARRFGITEKSLLRSLLNEVQGRTDENNVFYEIARMARKQIDQARAEIAHSIKSHLRKQFVSDLTDDQEVALSKFIIKADLSTLVDSYNPEQIQELITNPVKLAKAIQQTRYELKQGHNTQYNFYRRMARSLGNMMVKGKPTEAHVLLNAKAIAELVGVAGRATPANSAAAEPLIDRLASLEALSILMREDTEAHAQFKSIVDAEFARDPEDNGVLFSLLTHRDYKERAKRDLFAGSELQMQKGYTREIYNPNKSFIVEDESREEELAKDGYVKVGSVPSDPLDPNTSDRAMYVSDMGTLAPWQAGAISTANKNAKGTSYFKTVVDFNDPTMVVAAIAQLQQITDAKEHSAKAIFDNTSKPKEQTALVPVLDPSGKITDYRYMMEEKTKDLLDRNLRITDVLGAMEGNMKSKVSGEDINRQVADALVEDYQDNYLRNPRGYVNISPDSDREDLVELYRLMPHEMREYIRTKTGSSGIYVKEELVKLLFGQRNFSASMWAKEKMQLAEASSQQMNSFMKPVYRLLGAPLTSKIGQGWEELVSLIKDTIVIKSFTTLFGNIVSNNVLLWSLGVPIKDVIVGQENAVRYAEEFQVVHEQIVDIEREIAVEKQKQQTPARRNKIVGLEAEKTRLEDSLEVNPLKELMDEGVYQSIIEDVDMLKDEFSYKSRLEEWVSPFTDNVPDGVKTVGSYALLTQDTKVYQILRRSTQLSDLAARYVLHLHNQKKGMSKENSINNVVDTFIDYDLPTHKGIDYLNRKGGIFFTKYFLRIQKIIVNTVKTAPARILGLTLLQELFGNFSDITDSFALFKDIFFMFSNPVKTTGAYFDTHPWLNLLD